MKARGCQSSPWAAPKVTAAAALLIACGPSVEGLRPRAWSQVVVDRVADAQVVDTRPREAWLAGHIPGAVHLHWSELVEEDLDGLWGPRPRPALAELLGARGVDPDGPVVLVGSGPLGDGDDGNVYWTLRYMGHPDTRVLDGGQLGWLAGGGRAHAGAESAPPTLWAAEGDDHVMASSEMVDNWAGVVLDVRSEGEFERGHIPGSTWFEWSRVFDGERLHTESEVRRQLEEAGIRSDTEVVTTCRSGIRAGHTFMILEALGLPGAATYVGSWRRWTAEGRPVER